jgi:hypothetical protein
MAGRLVCGCTGTPGREMCRRRYRPACWWWSEPQDLEVGAASRYFGVADMQQRMFSKPFVRETVRGRWGLGGRKAAPDGKCRRQGVQSGFNERDSSRVWSWLVRRSCTGVLHRWVWVAAGAPVRRRLETSGPAKRGSVREKGLAGAGVVHRRCSSSSAGCWLLLVHRRGYGWRRLDLRRWVQCGIRAWLERGWCTGVARPHPLGVDCCWCIGEEAVECCWGCTDEKVATSVVRQRGSHDQACGRVQGVELLGVMLFEHERRGEVMLVEVVLASMQLVVLE